MNKVVYSIVYMFIISFFFTALVSVVKISNADKIKRNQQLKLQRTILQVLQITVDPELLSDALVSLFENRVKTIEDKGTFIYVGYEPDGETIKAYAFPVSGSGFWGTIYGMVGVNSTAEKILGVSFYKHSETPGLGGRISENWFTDQFKGLPLIPHSGDKKLFSMKPENDRKTPNELDAITGASGTSRAVELFLNHDLNMFLNRFKTIS